MSPEADDRRDIPSGTHTRTFAAATDAPPLRHSWSTAGRAVEDAGGREILLQRGIAILTVLFGILGFIAATTPAGTQGSAVRTTILLLVVASTIPVAFSVSKISFGNVWWSRPRSMRAHNHLFVAYADIGVAAALCTFASPLLALHGATTFAVVGAYVAHFVRFRVVIAHLVFSSTVIVALAARAVYDGHPIGMVLYFALVSLVASNGIVLLLSAYSTAFKSTMQTQLDWANTDALTGVLNRRGFSVAADSIVAATPPVAVIMLDVDRFKQINDAYGHSVGDAILSRLAARVQELAGPDAVVGRLGGDEFAVALRSSPQAVRILIHAIQQTPLDVLSGSPVTVSIGAAIYREGPTLSDEYRDLLEQATALADEALLMAKNAGRNTHTIIDHDHVAERTQEQRIAPIDSLRSRRRRLIHSPNTHGPGRHS
ncbi:sensor domain-containing diguanylate cyclase [Gordonia polyisoprenivorans]|uniref:GGDEF domain-containing protein n=1 Tax=Gordonia polyisoprenivorans TaxID=84595 RepID=UPI000B99E939|nr:diguanylate cyclase [Gordonia polyisoprenivorans]OZC32492.1 GGDEF domain-containing protein [Gordonia polyisoprenivorans]UZF55906.1 diguanylate cyclase [Gordonia polyisoprenivorans]